MNILFRCKASHEIGFGHISRCLTLSNKIINQKDVSIRFSINKNEFAEKLLNENNYNYSTFLLGDKYVQATIDLIIKLEIDIFILDVRNDLDIYDIKLIRNKTKVKIISYDDPELKRLECDQLFYPPVPQIKTMDWKNFKGDLNIGWEYVLINEKFCVNKVENNKEHIILSFGGSDPKNITQYVIECLTKMKVKSKVIIVLGPGYKNKESLNNFLNDTDLEYEIYFNPKNLVDLISKSHFGIISFGQTAYEFAAMKVPSLYICLSKDHLISSSIFTKNNYGISCGTFGEFSFNFFFDCYRKINDSLIDIRFSLEKSNLSILFSSSKIVNKILS